MSDYAYLALSLLIFVPLLTLWIWCIFDAFSRQDLKLSSRALWAIAVIFLPFLGGIAYLFFRARRKPAVIGSEDAEGYYDPLPTSTKDAANDRLLY